MGSSLQCEERQRRTKAYGERKRELETHRERVDELRPAQTVDRERDEEELRGQEGSSGRGPYDPKRRARHTNIRERKERRP